MFRNIFHKHLTISPSILIESEPLPRRDGASVNDSEWGGSDFDLEETLKAYGEVEDMELRLSFGNNDCNDNSDSDFHSVFFFSDCTRWSTQWDKKTVGKCRSRKETKKNDKVIGKQYTKWKWEWKRYNFYIYRYSLFNMSFFSTVKAWLSKIQNTILVKQSKS